MKFNFLNIRNICNSKKIAPFFFWNLFFIFILNYNVLSQDIHFSQFFETPLLRNPALAGIFSGDMRLNATFRSQWQNSAVPYQTGSFSAEFKLPIGKRNDFVTVGGELLYDKAGSVSLTTTQALPAVNYHKSLSADRNMYLSLAFMGGLVQRSIDLSKVTTNSQFDGNGYNSSLGTGETFSKSSYTFFDGSTGVSFNSQVGGNKDNNFFLGIAYHHFNKPSDISFFNNPGDELMPKWVYSGGLRLSTTNDSYITLQGDYSQQGPYNEFIGGALLTKKLDNISDPQLLIDAGLFIRWQDAIIPVVKLEKKHLAISVSYDSNISTEVLSNSKKGAFEMALTYQKYYATNSSLKAVRCPKF